MANEIELLNRIRLRERWTVSALARSIGVERSTLQRALKVPNRRPWDQTLEPIRDWLKKPKDQRQRKSIRPRSRVA